MNHINKKNKLLLISPIFVSKKQLGHAPFMQNMLDAYLRNGLKVEVLVKRGRSNHFIQKFFSYIFFYIKILLKNTRKYDFVQISFPTLVYPIIALKNFGNAKIFVRFHGEDLLIPENSKIKSILKWFSYKSITMSNLVVVPSKYFSNIVNEIDSTAKTYVYPSGGVDLYKFYPKENQIIRKNVLSIGYVGRLSFEKGLNILIDAIEIVSLDIELHIVGDGPDKKYLLKYAKNKRINLIYHGSVSNDKLVEYYNLFDVFVFPTRAAESFGNVGVEAMACARPVIASDIGGIREYLINNYNGYLFEVGNIIDLASKINKYISLDDDEINIMKNNALSTSKLFETNYLTKKFIKLLNNL